MKRLICLAAIIIACAQAQITVRQWTIEEKTTLDGSIATLLEGDPAKRQQAGKTFQAKFLSRTGWTLPDVYARPTDSVLLQMQDGSVRAYQTAWLSPADRTYLDTLGNNAGKSISERMGNVKVRSDVVTTYPECNNNVDQVPNDAFKMKRVGISCEWLTEREVKIYVTDHFAIHVGAYNANSTGWKAIDAVKKRYETDQKQPFDVVQSLANFFEQLVAAQKQQLGVDMPISPLQGQFKIHIYLCDTGACDTTGGKTYDNGLLMINVAAGFDGSNVNAQHLAYGQMVQRSFSADFAAAKYPPAYSRDRSMFDAHAAFVSRTFQHCGTNALQMAQYRHLEPFHPINKMRDYLWMRHMVDFEEVPVNVMASLPAKVKVSADGRVDRDFVQALMGAMAESGKWPQGAVAFGDAMARYAARFTTMDYEFRALFMQSLHRDVVAKPEERLSALFTPLRAMPDRAGYFRPYSASLLPYTFGINTLLFKPRQGGQCDAGWKFGVHAFSANSHVYAGVSAVVALHYRDGRVKYTDNIRFGTMDLGVERDVEYITVGLAGAPREYVPIQTAGATYRSNHQFAYEIYAPCWDAVEVQKRIAALRGVGQNGVEFNPADLVVHANGGGRKSRKATVADTAFIAPKALVLDEAKVLGNAKILDGAVIAKQAQVLDDAVVRENVVVTDTAVVKGRAMVSGDAYIGAKLVVSDDVLVGDYAVLTGNTGVSEQASILDLSVVDAINQAATAVSGRVVAMESPRIFGAASQLQGDVLIRGSSQMHMPHQGNIGGSATIGRSFIYVGCQQCPKINEGLYQGTCVDSRDNAAQTKSMMVANYAFDVPSTELAFDSYESNDAYVRTAAGSGYRKEADVTVLSLVPGAYMILPETLLSFRAMTIQMRFRMRGRTAPLLHFQRDGENYVSLVATGLGNGKVKLRLEVKYQNQVVIDETPALEFADSAWTTVTLSISNQLKFALSLNGQSALDKTIAAPYLVMSFRGTANYVGYSPLQQAQYDMFDLDSIRVYRGTTVEEAVPPQQFGYILEQLQKTWDGPFVAMPSALRRDVGQAGRMDLPQRIISPPSSDNRTTTPPSSGNQTATPPSQPPVAGNSTAPDSGHGDHDGVADTPAPSTNGTQTDGNNNATTTTPPPADNGAQDHDSNNDGNNNATTTAPPPANDGTQDRGSNNDDSVVIDDQEPTFADPPTDPATGDETSMDDQMAGGSGSGFLTGDPFDIPVMSAFGATQPFSPLELPVDDSVRSLPWNSADTTNPADSTIGTDAPSMPQNESPAPAPATQAATEAADADASPNRLVRSPPSPASGSGTIAWGSVGQQPPSANSTVASPQKTEEAPKVPADRPRSHDFAVEQESSATLVSSTFIIPAITLLALF